MTDPNSHSCFFRRSMAPRSWSDLPDELLEMILKQPTDVVNLYHYRDVCRSWRSVADKLLASSPLHLLAYEKRDRIVKRIRLFNFLTGELSVCKIPEFKTGDGQPLFPRIVYSWHRWLVMDCTISQRYSGRNRKNQHDHDHHICLYNPFSSARIRFPALTLDPTLDTQKRKFVFSSEPTNQSSIGFAIRVGRYLEKLMFWKPGDEEWTTFVEKQMIVDIISYRGGFCVLDGDLKFIQFDELGTPVTHLKIINVLSSYYHPNQFLVESLCGDLLLVQLNIGCKFIVFKLDWGRLAWDEIKSLGDEAIFLTCDESVCIRAGDSAIYKRNCIYFTDDVFSVSGHKEDFGIYEYDVANKTVDRFPHSFPYYNDRLCYRWFTPQI